MIDCNVAFIFTSLSKIFKTFAHNYFAQTDAAKVDPGDGCN